MTSHFIPMLSSSPPPFEEGGSFEDEDDEFGDFTAAARTMNDEDSPIKKVPPCKFAESDARLKTQHHQSNGHVEALERSADEYRKTRGPLRIDNECTTESSATATCSDEEDLKALPKQEQRDDTSQESATDSGHCSVSQNSETSPLPHIEGPGFMETELKEDVPVQDDVKDLETTRELVHESPIELRIAHNSSDEVDDLRLGSYDGETTLPESELRTACFHPLSEEEEDEFADFASAQVNPMCFEEVTSEDFPTSSGVEFADFEQASFGDFTGDQSEQWATFEMRQEETHVEKDQSQDSSSTHTKIVQMLHAAFPQRRDDNLETMVPSKQLIGSDESPSNRLWRKLEDLDQSVSLQYHWNGSRAFQRLLYSLNIDSRNIEVIPPAQFDWSSSGLVNPLDQMQSSSSLLDLDFFVRSSSTSSETAPPSSLEAEFLGPDVPSPGSTPALLQQLLKLSQSTMLESSRRPAELSEAAVRILDQLPDLSFMRAKVLMFPVRCTLDSS